MPSKKIRTLIVDDEPLALKGLRLRLESFDDIDIVGTASNGREAIKKIRAEKPDLVFLDIQMPGLDGFDVVKALANEELPIIIFATAFDKYAIQAFETHASDYLLKPIDEERLEQAIIKVREQIADHIAIEQNAKLIDLIRSLDSPPEIELSEILTSDDIFGIMQKILLREQRIDQDREHFWIIGLANNLRLLFVELIGLGTVNQVLVNPMEVFSFALQKRAVKIMLCHNHPSGELRPSDADKDTTDRMIQVGRIVNTPVIDHLIISDKSYVSFGNMQI